MDDLLKKIEDLEEEVARLQEDKAQTASLLSKILTRISHLEEDTTPTTSPAPARVARPASPAEFDGDRTKGRQFWNACILYMSMCPSEFPDVLTKISWILSYMKTDRAATFASQLIPEIADGQMPYSDFEAFQKDFQERFFPQHEQSWALNKFETDAYYQAGRSVQEEKYPRTGKLAGLARPGILGPVPDT